MKPRTLKILIAGIALLIFGPVLGWVCCILGLFHMQQSLAQTPPGAMPDIGQLPSRMMANLIPILIGIVLGAVGGFLTLYALITHMFGPKDDA